MENAARWPVVLMYANVGGPPRRQRLVARWSTPATSVTSTGSSPSGSAGCSTEDDPEFANWDQDATAVEEHYSEQDPAVVARSWSPRPRRSPRSTPRCTGRDWERPGRRSNGSFFTVASLGRYQLHDVVHHLVDVEG